MIAERLAELGYDYRPAPVEILTFHNAVLCGNLVFVSGQVSGHGDRAFKGKVGGDVDVATAQKAAELSAFNCICAAGSVVDVEKIRRVVKLTGFVNAADGFIQMSDVVHGASRFMTAVFGERGAHARSAIGVKVPGDWAVEVEAIFSLE